MTTLRSILNLGLNLGVNLGLRAKVSAAVVALYVWSIGAPRDLSGAGLLSYASILLIGIVLGLLFGRRDMRAGGARTRDQFESRLAERSKELEKSHLKLRVMEREQAIAIERQRLMCEMHDGLGSSLMSSLVMVEQGKLDEAQVATVLRESIDDLKLTIDSLEPMGDDLLTLLGTLRYRLGKRMETAGIALEWSVTELPTLTWLNPTSALQILRMMQEALTNVLKHARATAVKVETGFDAARVWIRLTDNGRGFDVAATRHLQRCGRGIQNLERRAAALSGAVRIESRPGATTVTLNLPRANEIAIPA